MVHGLVACSGMAPPRKVCLALWRVARRCDEKRPRSWARKEKICCGVGCGDSDGHRARRSLDAFSAGRPSIAPRILSALGRHSPRCFSMTAAMQFLVAQARDKVAPYVKPNLQRSRRRLPAKRRANPLPAPRRRQTMRAGVGPDRTRSRRSDSRLVSARQPRVPDDDHPATVDAATGWCERRRDCSKARGGEEAGPLAAAAKRADDERKAAEAERAKQAQAEQSKRVGHGSGSQAPPEAREAADKAAQKTAEEASRKAAAEAARKTAEQVKIKHNSQPPAPQPAAKPEDSARLAEEMRQERARLEAEANRYRSAAQGRRGQAFRG